MMASRVQKVRSKARPWRSIFALLLALAAAGIAVRWSTVLTHQEHVRQSTTTTRAIIYGSAGAFFVFGMAAAFGLSGKARAGLQPVIGQAHAGVLRYAVVLISLFILAVAALQLIGVSPSQLVVGGAVTGVLLGIAAQQSLANLFAGLVLLFAHPFRVGERVRFRAGSLSGQIDGTVVDVSLTYVRLETEDGLVMLPNAQALSAAVVLLKPSPPEFPDTPEPATPVPAGQASAAPAGGPTPMGAGTGDGATG